MVKILLPPGAESLTGSVKGVGTFVRGRGYTSAQNRSGNRNPRRPRNSIYTAFIISSKMNARIKANRMGRWPNIGIPLERDQVYATAVANRGNDWHNEIRPILSAMQDDDDPFGRIAEWEYLLANDPIGVSQWNTIFRRFEEVFRGLDYTGTAMGRYEDGFKISATSGLIRARFRIPDLGRGPDNYEARPLPWWQA